MQACGFDELLDSASDGLSSGACDGLLDGGCETWLGGQAVWERDDGASCGREGRCDVGEDGVRVAEEGGLSLDRAPQHEGSNALQASVDASWCAPRVMAAN